MKIKSFFSATLIASMTAMAFLFVATFSATQTFAQGTTVYNSISSPLPGNVSSLGYEATQTSEFGDQVMLSSSGNLITVQQVMSSWACQSGTWQSGCVSATGATFTHPITLNIYAIGNGNTPGALIGSVTQTFNIPYRPSTNLTNCPSIPGRPAGWFDGTNCYNGKATTITFNVGGLVVPNNVIYGIAYNTTHYGAAPIGQGASCFSTAAGCPYDSLNVGLTGNSPNPGVNPDLDDVYWNTSTAANYTDGGTDGVGIFRRDTLWTGFQPAVKFVIANPPSSADQCKKGGFSNFTRSNGSPFSNQGDCVSYTQNGK